MKKKQVNLLYWSRYNSNRGHLWFNLKGYKINSVAQRGQWVSGKCSHDKDFRPDLPVIRFLYCLRHPKYNSKIFISFEEYLAKLKKKHIPFKDKLWIKIPKKRKLCY